MSFSAGAGALIGGDFGGGIEIAVAGQSGKMKTPYFGGGDYAFFDATYAELSLAIFGGGGKFKTTSGGQSQEEDLSITNLNIGLLGKYPFAINDKLSVFPLLGIDFQATLSAKQAGQDYKSSDGKEAAGDFSVLWFKFGGGADYSLTEQIYLRLDVLYGIRVANKFENDWKDSVGANAKTLLGHGLTVKVGVGYKF